VDRKKRVLTLSIKARVWDDGDDREAVELLEEREIESASLGTIGELIRAQMEGKSVLASTSGVTWGEWGAF
jgi:hypothetical protein